jgi:cobalt-zinc-cadmium efflux system membrane fusion protein
VFLPKDANHFEIRRIGRGRDLGGEVEILSGLEPTDRIVVDGAFLLKAQAEKGEGGHDDH